MNDLSVGETCVMYNAVTNNTGFGVRNANIKNTFPPDPNDDKKVDELKSSLVFANFNFISVAI